jgi:hypothetical protein
MNNPYRVVIRNGVWYRELNHDFRSVNFPSKIVNHKKEMVLGKFFIEPNLFGHLSFQVRHQVHANNFLDSLVAVQLHEDNKVNITSNRSIQHHRTLE